MGENFSNYSREYFNDAKNSGKWFAIDILVAVIIAIFVFLTFFIIPRFFYEIIEVKGSSMLPTVHNEDKVAVFKTKNVDYGDIVIIDAKGLEGVNEETDLIIKRVIGLEGDTIWLDYDNETEEYKIYRLKAGETEAEVLNEPYIYENMKQLALYGNSFSVQKGYIFVIGDNRNNTYKDTVEVSRVLGKCFQISVKTKTFKFIDMEFCWYKTRFI